jgi:membrane associated rhomboid family serine protease
LQAAANMSVQTGGVAYWAHIGGFVFGIILAPLFGLFKRD